MKLSQSAVVGGLLFTAGCAVAGWAWATETFLEARGKTQNPFDWLAAAALILVGLAVLFRARRLSLIDMVVGLIVVALAGNVVLWVGATGKLDCALGKETAPPAPELVRVSLPARITTMTDAIAPNDEIRVVVVSRHHKPNDEQLVETTTYDATYLERTAVALQRGEDDADVAAFLVALADAQRVALFPAATKSSTPATCS